MGQRITIEIKDKIATCLTELPVVCGNSDYVVDFVFDEEWDTHDVKTAIFVVNGKATHQVFRGTACPVPVIQNTLIAWVGVFAGTIDDGTLSTSTPALVKCIPCATDGENVPLPPADDVYNKIIDLINDGMLRGDSVYIRYSANEDGTDFTENWQVGQAYIGFATAQKAPTNKSNYQWVKSEILSEAKTNRIKEIIEKWLIDHPNATTTVQDGSLTVSKFLFAKTNNVYDMASLGCISGRFVTIEEAFPDVTLAEVQKMDKDATLQSSHAWYAVQKIMDVDGEATIIVDGRYTIDRPIQLSSQKNIIGAVETSPREWAKCGFDVIGDVDAFRIDKYRADRLVLKDFSIKGDHSGNGDGIAIYRSSGWLRFENLCITRVNNGIRRYYTAGSREAHAIITAIIGCSILMCKGDCIHFVHNNSAQTNHVTIFNCELAGGYTRSSADESIDGTWGNPIELNEEYGNGICISGSGVYIRDTIIESCICGVHIANGYTSNMLIEGIYSETDLLYDIYLHDSAEVLETYIDRVLVDAKTCFLRMSKGIYLGDKKVERYGHRKPEEIEPFYKRDIDASGKVLEYIVTPNKFNNLVCSFVTDAELPSKRIDIIKGHSKQQKFINLLSLGKYIDLKQGITNVLNSSIFSFPRVGNGCGKFEFVDPNLFKVTTVKGEGATGSIAFEFDNSYQLLDRINEISISSDVVQIAFFNNETGRSFVFSKAQISENKLTRSGLYPSEIDTYSKETFTCTIAVVPSTVPNGKDMAVRQRSDGKFVYTAMFDLNDPIDSALLSAKSPVHVAFYGFKLPSGDKTDVKFSWS